MFAREERRERERDHLKKDRKEFRKKQELVRVGGWVGLPVCGCVGGPACMWVGGLPVWVGGWVGGPACMLVGGWACLCACMGVWVGLPVCACMGGWACLYLHVCVYMCVGVYHVHVYIQVMDELLPKASGPKEARMEKKKMRAQMRKEREMSPGR